MPDYVVCKLTDIPLGQSRRVTAGKRDIAIFNVQGNLHAIADRCPHEGGSLCKGIITAFVASDEPGEYRLERHGEMVRCPWHGWEFDILTGKSYCDPTRMKVRSYDVKVAPGETLAEGPYQIEIYDVSVKDDYVVVTL
jgi:Ferredoxin subunits of nitrite reductase and ring-hydroxylating dioxygenases